MLLEDDQIQAKMRLNEAEMRSEPACGKGPLVFITEVARRDLVRWLLSFRATFRLSPDTLSHAVAILDRFLASTEDVIQLDRLRLVGVVSLMIAAKMDGCGISEFTPKRCCGCTAHQYTVKEAVAMEWVILNGIRFRLVLPHAMAFFPTDSITAVMRVRDMAQYLLELALPELWVLKNTLDSTRSTGAILAARAAMRYKRFKCFPGIDHVTRCQDLNVRMGDHGEFIVQGKAEGEGYLTGGKAPTNEELKAAANKDNKETNDSHTTGDRGNET